MEHTFILNDQQLTYLKWLLENEFSKPTWQISSTDKAIVAQIINKLEN